MLTRRRFLIISSQTVAGLVPSAFGNISAKGATKDVEPRTTLTSLLTAIKGRARRTTGGISVLYPKGCRGNLEPVIAEFQRLTGVDIILRESALDEIASEMILENKLRRTSTRFDVAIPATFSIPDLVESGTIAAIDDFAAKYEPVSFATTCMYTLGDRYQGNLYGYQTDGDAYLMFYSRNLLESPKERQRYADRFGQPLRIPQTWPELDQQMKFFHRPNEDQYGGSLYRNRSYGAWEFWTRFHAKGFYPVDDTMNPQLDNDAGVQALEEMTSATRWLEPSVFSNGLFDNFVSYAQGNKYCNIGWGGTQKFLNSANSRVKNRIAHGLIPGGMLGNTTVSMPYFNWGWNYVVASRSRDPELAYLFILFASTAHISTQSVREPSGYFDPFRREHYTDSTIQRTYGSNFLQVHQESLEKCIPDFYLRGQGRYFSSLKHAVHAVNGGHLSPRKALTQVSTRWQRITDELGRDDQIRQWQFLKRSYPAHLRGLLR